jgi:putative tricarboxylic transport membrane protein
VELWSQIIDGFQAALTPTNLAYCFIGVLLGTVIGLLPGLGSATGVAILLPLTLMLDPLTALIMLAGIYYGTQYGATISSVLVSTPGDSATVVTTIDGYQLARQGRAGPALAIAAIASFLAGTISILLLMTLAPVFAGFALNFGPPETVALVTLGLAGVIGFTGTSRAKGLAMGALGLAIATVGIDAQTGIARFTFGQVELLGGIGFLAVIIGLFAVAEVMSQVSRGGGEPIRTRFRDMLLSREDWRRSRMPIVRGGIVGFFLGVLPGAGATLASFLSYDIERRLSKRPERFGKGAMEGVAAPEAANNAAVNGAFVPTLTLGIPGSGTTAVLLGAFLLFGLQPGPLLLEQQPELVWGLIASFYIGNLILLLLNLPLAPAFASILRLRYTLLYPFILLLAFIGAYAIENRLWGVWMAFAFGVIGYFMKRYGYPAAPVILGLILGGLFEQSLEQTSSMGGGSFAIFLERPIALALFALAGLIILGPFVARGVKALAGKATARVQQ